MKGLTFYLLSVFCVIRGLENNYCRNPGNQKAPWCYTTDQNTRWDYCKLNKKDCFYCNGEDYRGHHSTTENGYICQRWDSQSPHSHKFTPTIYPNHSLEENYCRNPEGNLRPWCYTTSWFKKWDYCSIPRCKSEPPSIVPVLTCMTGRGEAYRGNISVTWSDLTCQNWSAQTPHKHDFTPENYPCK
uniref:Kringle domain-containing protein n=1 Tax=Kryptolebias marmoratus TaxID=37003 RepID=A0A3Q3AT96_KRYMA